MHGIGSGDRLRNGARVLFQFFSTQSLIMAANMLYGLLCVRLLAPSEYTKYIVVFGVQGTVLILMDANFSGTLIPLIGERIEDKRLIADYVAALRRLSLFAYAIVASGMAVFFPLLVRNRQWSVSTIAAMIAILVVSTWCMRIAAAYGPVLIMLRDRNVWYQGQLVNSIGPLVLLLICWACGWLTPFLAILFNVSGIVYVAALCYFRANHLLGGKGVATREKQKAIVRLALPNMPQAFFFALQGQISLFLITYFGHTRAVASVGALGRLSQIFAIFLQANGMLVEPYFAKLPKEALKKSYVIALLLAALVSSTIAFAVILFPQTLLWILGPQYAGLQFEVKISVITAAISCFSGVLWGIHSARRFVFWWNVAFSIGLTLVVQVLFIAKTDISTVRGVLWLNLATNLASLTVNVLAGIYGFVKGPREVESESLQESSAAQHALGVEVYEAEEMGTAQSLLPLHPTEQAELLMETPMQTLEDHRG